MQSVKIDQFLKAAIVLLRRCSYLFLYFHPRAHRGRGRFRPDFSITADNGRVITASNFGGGCWS
jgi:hypothetical protein